MNSLKLGLLLAVMGVSLSQVSYAQQAAPTRVEIRTCQQLQDINKIPPNNSNDLKNMHFVLMNNINCTETKNWNWDTRTSTFLGFTPLGDVSLSMKILNSTFDGQNYQIINFYSRSGGLFGSGSGRLNIVNLKFKDVDVVDGVLASSSYGGNIIENVHVNGGKVSGQGIVGGLRSSTPLYGEVIRKSSVNNVVIAGEVAGGLVGELGSSSIIDQCRTSGQIKGLIVGGLVGKMGDVYHYHAQHIIKNSYSLMEVTSTGTGDIVGIRGGLVGKMSTGVIRESHFAGTLKGMADYSGGAVGFKEGPTVARNLYWDVLKSKESISAGSSAAGALTTGQMSSRASFMNWDFGPIWYMKSSNGHPKLEWEKSLL